MDDDLIYRQWIASKPKAALLLVHGLGAHGGRWEPMAEFFLKDNISSYAIECPEFEDFDDHILRLHAIMVNSCPAKKIFLVGESLGALIAFIVAVRHRDRFSGLVCLSPAFRSKLKLPISEYMKISAFIIYNPRKHIDLPFNSSMCTRDMERRIKMDSDDRERRWTSSASVARIFLFQITARLLVKRLSMPVLFLVAGDDKIVDTKESIKVFKRLRVRDKNLIEYSDMYHSLSIDLGKERVFEDLLKWISDRIKI